MLQLKQIHKQYKTGELVQTALDSVSLNLRDNEFLAILGPSGSGKTTLFKCCLNFLRAAEGEVRVDGRPTARLSPAALARLAALPDKELARALGEFTGP